MFYAEAINQLTRSLACDWARDNIMTNCVAPASTRTPLTENVSAFVLSIKILIK
jgi:NAD(P)-dependent dehydrogenase (short-subunit alcohol dehydrogenase family)